MQVIFCSDCGDMYTVSPGAAPLCPNKDSHEKQPAEFQRWQDRQRAKSGKRPRI